MNHNRKKLAIMVLVLFMFITVIQSEPLNVNAMDTEIDEKQTTESKKEETDVVKETKQKIPTPQETKRNAVSSTKGQATDSKWFIFSGNTITGYSSDRNAPRNIVIPSSYVKDGATYDITVIGENAFAGQQLTSVVLNDNLISIEASAFVNNADIEEIIIPDSVTKLEARAFEGCTNLTRATLSQNITEISYSLFSETGLTSIEIPNGVQRIDNNAFYKTSLIDIVLPNSLTQIGSFVFSHCPLTSITFPNKVANIGTGAFENCEQLEEVKFPRYSNLYSISDMLFFGCKSLTMLELPDSVGYIGRAFEGSGLQDISMGSGISGTGSISGNAFYTCENLKIRFNNKRVNEVTGSPWGAINPQIYWKANDTTPFYVDTNGSIQGFKPLDHESIQDQNDETNGHTTANIPSVITGIYVNKIAAKAFSQVSTLQEITLPANLTDIGNNAFENCDLRTIEFNDSLQNVGVSAFKGNERLNEVQFASDIKTIGSDAFSNTAKGIKIRLESKELNSVAGSPWGANNPQIYWKANDTSCFYFDEETGTIYGFKPMDHINHTIIGEHTHTNDHTIANIPESINGVSVTGIGDNSFRTVALTSVTFPESIINIGAYAFYDTQLTSLQLPNNLQQAGNYSFANITTLKTTTVPASLTKIADYMFASSGLTSISLEEGIIELGEAAFETNHFTTIAIPSSVEVLGDRCFANGALETITIPASVETINEGCLAENKNLTTVHLSRRLIFIPAFMFDGCTKLENIVIPNTVTGIGGYAFRNTSITRISLSSDFKAIASFSFAGSKLEEIVIPDKVTTIGDSAFKGCANLRKVTLSKSLDNIALNAFKDCISLEEIQLPTSIKRLWGNTFDGCTNLRKLNLPEGLEQMGADCIRGTNITDLTIPSTITESYNFSANALVGYQGSRLQIQQSRATSPIAAAQPWGSDLGPTQIFYLGEFMDMKDTVTYHSNNNAATISITTTALTDSVVKEVTLPDGRVIENINEAIHTLEYPVEMNGEYTFTATSPSGDISTLTVIVDEIEHATIEANGFAISYFDVAQLNEATIIKKANARGIKTIDDKELSVHVDTLLEEIRTTLDGPDKSTQIVLYVETTTPSGQVVRVEKEIYIYTASIRDLTVTFLDMNHEIIDKVSVFEGDTVVAPIPPKVEGYQFTGWDQSLENIQEDTTIQALYIQRKYTLHYDTNGGSPEIPEKTNITWEQNNLLPNVELIRDHYTQESYWVATGGIGRITNASTFEDIAKGNDEVSTATIQAIWKPIQYTLKFNSNGGIGSKGNIQFDIEDNKIQIGDNPFYKEGCTFEGWNTSPNGDGIAVADEAEYTPELKTHILYAQWKEQGATYYVSIPDRITLKNETNGSYAIATEKIKLIDANVDAGTMPDRNIEILCNPELILFNWVDNKDQYVVDIYDETGNVHTNINNPIMVLNKQEREKQFQLKTPQNHSHVRSRYLGELRFLIQYGE